MNLKDKYSDRYDSHRSMGKSAYWDGYDAKSNPFTRGTPASKAFALGWLRGRREEKDLYGVTSGLIDDSEEMLRVR